MIQPYLNYGILAWGNASQSLINKTFLLQKKAIRIISKAAYNSHTEPLFKTLKILKLEDQYTYEVIMFMYKYMQNKLPESFSGTFRFNRDVQASYLTRQSSQLAIERCDSNTLKKFPIYSFPSHWNTWGHIVQASNTVANAKKRIKLNFLNKYSDMVTCSNPSCKQCKK